MKKIVLGLLLVGLSNQAYSFSEEVQKLYTDAKAIFSKEIGKALSFSFHLSTDEQIVHAIKNRDLTALILLESEINTVNLNSYLELAQNEVKSTKINSRDNYMGLAKIILGGSLLISISTYTILKYYLLTTENSCSFNVTNFIKIFKRKESEPLAEYFRDQAAKFIDLAVPLVIGSYLVSKGGKSLQLRYLSKDKMKRLAILSYLTNLTHLD